MGFPRSEEDDAFEVGSPGDAGGAKGAEPHPQRPDWLTDADTGAADEAARGRGADETLERPRLVSRASESAPTPARAAPVRWSAAASSIPTLRVRQAAASERGDARFEPEETGGAEPVEYLGSDSDGLSSEPVASVAPARTLAPLEEPWWMVAADSLRHDWRLQAAVAAVVLALGAFVLWPRSSPEVSLRTILRHPQQYDGRAVTVRGRVGDVFRMGGGYTFYLEQGHESIVVFTRSRVPVSRQTLTIQGSISTGYLDGQARQTLFESAP